MVGSRWLPVAALSLLGLAAAAAPAEAQAAAGVQAGATAPACGGYDACALRIEEGKIVRGIGGARVGRLGIFSAPRLAPLMEGADSAAAHARIFDREYRRGALLTWTGAALTLPMLFDTYRDGGLDDDDVNLPLLGLGAVGLGVEIWGLTKVTRARRALSRAIWWYNRDLPH